MISLLGVLASAFVVKKVVDKKTRKGKSDLSRLGIVRSFYSNALVAYRSIQNCPDLMYISIGNLIILEHEYRIAKRNGQKLPRLSDDRQSVINNALSYLNTIKDDFGKVRSVLVEVEDELKSLRSSGSNYDVLYSEAESMLGVYNKLEGMVESAEQYYNETISVSDFVLSKPELV